MPPSSPKKYPPLPTKPWLWAYLYLPRMTPIRSIMSFILICIFAAAIAIEPYIIQKTLQYVRDNDTENLFHIAIWFLGLQWFITVIKIIIDRYTRYVLANEWWLRIQPLILAWYRKVSPDAALRMGLANIAKIVDGYTDNSWNVGHQLVHQIPFNITNLLVSSILVIVIFPQIWWGILLLLISISLFSWWLNRLLMIVRNERRELERAIEARVLRSILAQWLLLRRDIFSQESDTILGNLPRLTTIQRKQATYQLYIFEFPIIVGTLARVLLIISLVYWLGWITDPLIEIPVLFTLLSTMGYSVHSIGDMIGDFYSAIPKVDKFFETVRDLPLAPNLDTGTPYIPKGWALTFENVSFAYSESKKSLNAVNVTIKSGEHIALVGPSGAGKTTFVRLAIAYLLPTQGRILLDGQDTKSLDLASIVEHVGYLQQEPQLFDGSIVENLTYGLENISQEKISQALRDAAADFVLDDLKEWVNSIIGERGLLLSGGERQRLAIARLFLQNPTLIILDEPTAALDSISEAKVTEAIHRLSKGKTIITIAHRLQTVREADRIIVLQKWHIEAIGSHDELTQKSELYASMVDLQSGIVREITEDTI